MPKRKWYKLYYEHLALCGSNRPYIIVDGDGALHDEIKLHLNDVLLLDRIISFEENKTGGKSAPLRFYMTNEQIGEQLSISPSTASKCVKRLQRIGLVKTYYERPVDGKVAGRRFISVQSMRLRTLLELRKEQPEGVVTLAY